MWFISITCWPNFYARASGKPEVLLISIQGVEYSWAPRPKAAPCTTQPPPYPEGPHWTAPACGQQDLAAPNDRVHTDLLRNQLKMYVKYLHQLITLNEGFFLHAMLDVLLWCHQVDCTVRHWWCYYSTWVRANWRTIIWNIIISVIE